MIPSGHFTGTVHGRFGKLIGKVWTGKVFTGSSVVNKIAGREAITGNVREEADGMITITYPQLGGLQDRLYDDGGILYGTMKLWGQTVRFTLVKVKE